MSEHQQQFQWREHWDVALRFRQRGIEELRDGDDLVGSELMWGAAARATKAAAARMGMPHGSHRELFWVAQRLSDESGVEGLRGMLGTASSLHEHYYESHLESDDIEAAVASAEEFFEIVAEVLRGMTRCNDTFKGNESDPL